MGERGRCKVDRVVDAFDLDAPSADASTLDAFLLDRWKGQDGQDPMGYRTLTEWFNKRLLKRVYDARGRAAIATRLDSEYAALTGDDDLARKELIRDLEEDGIDTERLLDGFVSWSTMRHHLTGCLGGEKASQAGDSDWERESLEAIRESTEARVDKVVRSLSSKGKVPGAADCVVHVDIQLSCPECPTRVSVERALDQGYVCRTHLVEPESLLSS